MLKLESSASNIITILLLLLRRLNNQKKCFCLTAQQTSLQLKILKLKLTTQIILMHAE